jgi:hypothetical protein
MEGTMSHTPLHELLSAFDQAVDLFNAKGDLTKVFCEDVILVKAKNPKPIFGKDDVYRDFVERYAHPTGVEFTVTTVDATAKDEWGVVDGVGLWLDKELNKKLPIQFVFIFHKHKDKDGNKWRIRTLWGSPSH